MSVNTNDLAFVRQVKAFVKEESAFGELADFTSTDAIGVNALPGLKQPLSFSDSREKRDTRSIPKRFRDNTPAGSVSLQTYVTPSGVAGTPPREAALWEGFFGTETIVAATSVAYTPALTLPSLSIAYQVGHTTQFASGCVMNALGLELGAKDGFELSAEGMCKKVVTAGKGTTVAGSTDTVLNMTAGEAAHFEVGARIEVGDDDNTGAGYTISEVDTTADTVTVSTALSGGAPAAGVTVQGFLPTPTYSGDSLANNLAVVTLDGAPLLLESGKINFEQEIKMRDDLVTNEDYPVYFTPHNRKVGADLTAIFLREIAAKFTQARTQVQMPFVLTLDGGAGSKFTYSMSQSECNTPELSGDEDVIASFGVSGMPTTSGEDEASATFE